MLERINQRNARRYILHFFTGILIFGFIFSYFGLARTFTESAIITLLIAVFHLAIIGLYVLFRDRNKSQ